jgi:hypothetical protein
MKYLKISEALDLGSTSINDSVTYIFNYLVLSQSLILALTYLTFLVLVLRAVKSHVFGRLFLVYLSTLTCYFCRLALDSFTVIYQLEGESEKTENRHHYMIIYALRLLNNFAEKGRDMLILFFIYQVQEVRIKLEAETV